MSVRVFIQGFAIGSAVAGGSVFLYFSTHEKNVETLKTDLKYFENFKSGPEAIKYKNHFENFKFGLPSRGPDVIKYKNHLLCYDQSRKTPIWVAEHITKANIEGEANRKGSKFQTDSKIPTLFSATNEDFLRSGWSRGHMAPAGNNKHDQKSMDETFLLSNIVPQDMENNSGYWNLIEIYCRDLTKKFSDVFVISGPLFLPSVESDGKTYVKHEAIGKNHVGVPTHLFKIIIAENSKNSQNSNSENSKNSQNPDENLPAVAAFIVPNGPIPTSHPLKSYQVSLEKLEQYSGLSLLPNLDRLNFRNLCLVDGCNLKNSAKFNRQRLFRDLAQARSLNFLESAWNSIQLNELSGDSELRKEYEEKKAKLMKNTNEKESGAEENPKKASLAVAA